jgi:hypothetical protein
MSSRATSVGSAPSAAASISPCASRSSGGIQASPRRGALAEGDVVRLRAGEVLQERSPLGRLDDPQVDLEPVVQDHGRLGVAERGDLLDGGMLAEAPQVRGRIVARRDEVDVADRLLAAP